MDAAFGKDPRDIGVFREAQKVSVIDFVAEDQFVVPRVVPGGIVRIGAEEELLVIVGKHDVAGGVDAETFGAVAEVVPGFDGERGGDGAGGDSAVGFEVDGGSLLEASAIVAGGNDAELPVAVLHGGGGVEGAAAASAEEQGALRGGGACESVEQCGLLLVVEEREAERGIRKPDRVRGTGAVRKRLQLRLRGRGAEPDVAVASLHEQGVGASRALNPEVAVGSGFVQHNFHRVDFHADFEASGTHHFEKKGPVLRVSGYVFGSGGGAAEFRGGSGGVVELVPNDEGVAVGRGVAVALDGEGGDGGGVFRAVDVDVASDAELQRNVAVDVVGQDEGAAAADAGVERDGDIVVGAEERGFVVVEVYGVDDGMGDVALRRIGTAQRHEVSLWLIWWETVLRDYYSRGICFFATSLRFRSAFSARWRKVAVSR